MYQHLYGGQLTKLDTRVVHTPDKKERVYLFVYAGYRMDIELVQAIRVAEEDSAIRASERISIERYGFA